MEEAKIAEAAVIGTSTIIDEAIIPRSPIKPISRCFWQSGVFRWVSFSNYAGIPD